MVGNQDGRHVSRSRTAFYFDPLKPASEKDASGAESYGPEEGATPGGEGSGGGKRGEG